MRRRFIVLLLAGSLLWLPACSETVEGVQEDTQENVEDAEEGVEEAGQEAEQEAEEDDG